MHDLFCPHCIAGVIAGLPLVGVAFRWAVTKYKARKGLVPIEITIVSES